MTKDYLYTWFRLDRLSSFVVLAIGLFSVLTVIYSLRFMKGRRGLFQYYACIVLTAIISVGAVFSNNLILLLVFWGFLGLTLYLLVNMGEDASGIAKKTFIIVGGSDALMLLGVGIIYYLTGTFQMDKIKISLPNTYHSLPMLAYLCIAVAAFAKAGAIPFHSWIPDCAKRAPLPVVAYLPASLDKLLGIYLLARISLDLFVMNPALNIFLMLIGVLTIIAAVMMALVQHNMKRLLGYHAVSQVGYMVLGIGTGNPIGIAGGIFHMFNHAIYKSCLFFASGNVEYQAHTSELDELGGLAKTMPITYVSALIASLSISGVPPFNGFFSKWMIYQGLVKNFPSFKFVSMFCLTLAMFGSGLTLASFMKLLHATFLGQPTEKIAREKPKEVSWLMWLPVLALSLLCIAFGAFAYTLPLKYFIYPALGAMPAADTYAPGISTALVVLGIIIGLAIYYISRIKKAARRDNYFIGGEIIPLENKVSGTEFYNTIKEFGVLKSVYNKAEAGFFDIYEQGKNIAFGIGKFFQYLHNGILPTYLAWVLLGMVGLFLRLSR